MMPTRKRCAKCGQIRLVKLFWKQPHMKSGLHSYCKDCAGAANRKSLQRHQETKPRCELRRRLKQYGLTIDEYERLIVQQNGVCAICRKREKQRTRLSVDHNHETGVIRGLLCVRCNAGIGQFLDDPMLLRTAAVYLEKTDA